jgi:diguanylate cyclase (GGDEF)-like protein
MIDIDEFKAYNDSYGHQAGDACLRTTATTLAGTLRRAGDFTARYGGEEFAAIISGGNMEQAARVAEVLRARVEAATRAKVGTELPSGATISVGLAWLVPGKSTTAAAVIGAADRALYAAKQSGRNRVCFATDPPNVPSDA